MNMPKDQVQQLTNAITDENPEELCKSENIDIKELEKSLMSIGYKYNPEINQFR